MNINDISKIKDIIHNDVFKCFGEKYCFNEEEITNTPLRIVKMFINEYFSGLKDDPEEILSKTFKSDSNDIVMQRDIPFCSVCAHHMVPFRGYAHIGYIPDNNIVGLSKLGRLVDCFARRPQLQEKMTYEIAESLMQHLKPLGCMVIIKAEHLCVTTRGVRKPGSETVTSAVRGIFKDSSGVRQEFLELLKL